VPAELHKLIEYRERLGDAAEAGVELNWRNA
jgi:hypothetical protein